MSNPILPLIILLVVVAIFAVIGYIAWSTATEITRNTRSRMEKKNVMFSRDGMKVGVKEIQDEELKDRSQRFVYIFFSSFFLSFFPSWGGVDFPLSGWKIPTGAEEKVKRRKS